MDIKISPRWCSREQAAKKAIVAVYGEKGLEKYEPFWDDFSIDLSDNEDDYYESDVQIFKMLFNSSDKNLRKAAWNALIPYAFGINEMEHRYDFTDKELAFLTDHQRHYENRVFCYSENPNKSFSTKRLFIRPCWDEDSKPYFYHLKNDGDFTIYTSLKLTRDTLYAFHLKQPLLFSVFEKDTGNMVGVVGLHHYERKRRKAFAQWYIFKPYRKLGYAKEAFGALAKRAFEGKLSELVESSWKYKYRKRAIILDYIRAEIRETNVPSQHTAESCGFVKQFTDRNFFLVEDKFPENAVVYDLLSESINERT